MPDQAKREGKVKSGAGGGGAMGRAGSNRDTVAWRLDQPRFGMTS